MQGRRMKMVVCSTSSLLTTNKPTGVAAGYYHTVGLTKSGSVVAVGCGDWPFPNQGQRDVTTWMLK
jgi:hypothetical protein